MATACDAVVAWDMFSEVTHIVVGPEAFDKALTFKKEFPSVFFAKYQWIIECYKLQKRIPCKSYAWEMPEPKTTVNENKRPRLLSRGSTPNGDLFYSLEGMVLCVSRYVNEERTEVEQLCKYLGGTFTESLTKDKPIVNILICKDDQGAKFNAAVEWKVKHVKTLEWLRKCAALKRGNGGSIGGFCF